MLLSHGWDVPKVKDPPNLVPMSSDTANHLMTLEGPQEKMPEAKSLAKDSGFLCRNALGELIHAHVIARLDVSCAVCLLTCFSGTPHQEHYSALKHVCKYLCATKAWGIMYTQPKPLDGLPAVPFDFLSEDPNLSPFLAMSQDELLACLDAAHATELDS